jgi:hypothetical protein
MLAATCPRISDVRYQGDRTPLRVASGQGLTVVKYRRKCSGRQRLKMAVAPARLSPIKQTSTHGQRQ